LPCQAADPFPDKALDFKQLRRRGIQVVGRLVQLAATCRGESWSLQRAPLLFETSLLGVFTVDDVRQGSVKPVVRAVGEGSVAIGSIRQYLSQETSAGVTRPT
jgi:hypothetical protein